MAVLVNPVFEKPVETAKVISQLWNSLTILGILEFVMIFQDVKERIDKIYMKAPSVIWQKLMSQMQEPYPELAEKMLFAKSVDEWENGSITRHHIIEKESL